MKDFDIFCKLRRLITEYKWKKFFSEHKDECSKYFCASYTEPSLKQKFEQRRPFFSWNPSIRNMLENRDAIIQYYELEETYRKGCDLAQRYPYGTAIVCKDIFQVRFEGVDRMPKQVFSDYAIQKGEAKFIEFAEGLPIKRIEDFDGSFCKELLGYWNRIVSEDQRIQSLLIEEDIKNDFEDSVLADKRRSIVYRSFLNEKGIKIDVEKYCVDHIDELDAYFEQWENAKKREQDLKRKKAEIEEAKKRQEQQIRESLNTELVSLKVLVEQNDIEKTEIKVDSIDKIIQYATREQKDLFQSIRIDYSKKKEKGIPQEERLCYVNYNTPRINTKDDYYPIVRMPQKDCIVWPYRRGTIVRRGFKEQSFEDNLKRKINSKVHVLGDVNILPQNGVRPYEPDIALVYSENGLNVRIDIEIDEPYAAITNKPTHYIGCGDEFRDMNLNDLGWIVIRFSEKQVHQQTMQCIRCIARIIKSINQSFEISSEIENAGILRPDKRWTMLDAQKMANDKVREGYLQHEFGVTEDNYYTERDLKLTKFETSILDKVKHTVFVPTECHDSNTNDDNYYSENSKSYNKENECEQDQHIIFERLSHIYSIDGIQYKAVSNVIAELFPVFDTEYWSEIKANQKGVDSQQVAEEWDAKGQKSREVGVFLHQQIENYFLNQGLVYRYHFQYNGVFVKEDTTIDIHPEFGFFEQFINDHPLTPYRTEWKIFDRSTRIAGTIDLICKNGDGYDIYDWKRSEKIYDSNSSKCGFGALSHLKDTTLNHYKLQQNLYRYILEKQYRMRIKSMKLVVLHPKFHSYDIIDVERMDNEINAIIRML